MMLEQLVILAQGQGYLIPDRFIAGPVHDPDKQYRIIGIRLGNLDLAVRWRERASNRIRQLFCVSHIRHFAYITRTVPLTGRSRRCCGLARMAGTELTDPAARDSNGHRRGSGQSQTWSSCYCAANYRAKRLIDSMLA
jgi:hypothetical protein